MSKEKDAGTRLMETLVKAVVCKMGNWEGIMETAKEAGLFQPDEEPEAEPKVKAGAGKKDDDDPNQGTLTTEDDKPKGSSKGK